MTTAHAKTAAVIVSLITASTAHALAINTILPTGNVNCLASEGTCTGQATQLAALGGIAGVSLSAPGPINFDIPTGTSTVSIFSVGIMQGPSILTGTTIPVTYDFILGATNFSTITGWSLEYQIYTVGIASTGGVSETFIGSLVADNTVSQSGLNLTTSQEFSGASSLTFTNPATGGDGVRVESILTVDWNGGDDGITVQIPTESSVDFNSVPEPGTWGMVAGALALGGLYLRRKREI